MNCNIQILNCRITKFRTKTSKKIKKLADKIILLRAKVKFKFFHLLVADEKVILTNFSSTEVFKDKF